MVDRWGREPALAGFYNDGDPQVMAGDSLAHACASSLQRPDRAAVGNASGASAQMRPRLPLDSAT